MIKYYKRTNTDDKGKVVDFYYKHITLETLKYYCKYSNKWVDSAYVTVENFIERTNKLSDPIEKVELKEVTEEEVFLALL